MSPPLRPFVTNEDILPIVTNEDVATFVTNEDVPPQTLPISPEPFAAPVLALPQVTAPAASTATAINIPPPPEPPPVTPLRPIPRFTAAQEPPKIEYTERRKIVGHIKGEPQFKGTEKVPTAASVLAVTNDWMRRHITGEMLDFDFMQQEIGVPKGVLLNIFRSAKRVAPLGIPMMLEIAEALVDAPAETTLDLIKYPLEWADRLQTLADPLGDPLKKKQALEHWAEDPLGPFFAFMMARGGAKRLTRLAEGKTAGVRPVEILQPGETPLRGTVEFPKGAKFEPVSPEVGRSVAEAVLAREPTMLIEPVAATKALAKVVDKGRSAAQVEAARLRSQALRDLTVINPNDLAQMPAVQAIRGISASRDYPGLFEKVRIGKKGRSPIGAEKLLESKDLKLKQDYDVLDVGSLSAEFIERYGPYKDFDNLIELAREEISFYERKGKPADPYSLDSADKVLPEPIDIPESMAMMFSSVGIPHPQLIADGFKQISRFTSDMIENSKMPERVRIGFEQGRDLMVEHDRMIRRSEALSNWLEQVTDKVIPNPERQMLMIHALENKFKGKQWDQLNDLEKTITKWLGTEKEKLNKFVDDNKILERLEQPDINHIYHYWINPKTGQPYQAMYGKFSKGLPQAKQRTVSTYESGIGQGMTQATTNLGKLIGLEWQSVTRAHQSRQMFAGLSQVGSGIDATIIRRKKGKPKDLKMIERWDQLRDQGLTEGYQRYNHTQLDKPIVFKGADGKTKILKGAVGIREELYHHVRAYLEDPKFTTLDNLNNAAKSLKLASLFHAVSLGFQEAANFRIPFKNIPRGLKLAKDWGDPVIRLLFEEGLELKKGYEDIGYKNSFFTGETTLGKAGNLLTKPIELMRDFIFDVVQPGMKTSFAVDTYNKILPRYLEAGKKKGMTEKQSTQWAARNAVKAADGHFSGEHYKRSLLEANQFMVKLYFAPEARIWWQRALLSPTWQREHLLVAKRVAQSFMPESMIKKLGLEDLGPIKSEYRKYALGAVTIMGAADLWNLMATQQMDGEAKHLWENPEGKGFAVRAWWDEPDYTVIDENGKTRTIRGGPAYIRPLKSVFEVAEFVDDPIKKFGYKLSPFLTAIGHQLFPSRYQKEYTGWPDIPRRTKDFLLDVATPMAAERTALVLQGKRELAAGILPFFGFPTSLVKNKSKKATLNQVNKLILEGDYEEATALMNAWNNKHPGDFIVP